MVDAFDRVTPVRALLAGLVTGLLVVHGLVRQFTIDGTTAALLAVLVILVLTPLLRSASVAGLHFEFKQFKELSEKAEAFEAAAKEAVRRSRSEASVADRPPGTKPQDQPPQRKNGDIEGPHPLDFLPPPGPDEWPPPRPPGPSTGSAPPATATPSPSWLENDESSEETPWSVHPEPNKAPDDQPPTTPTSAVTGTGKPWAGGGNEEPKYAEPPASAISLTEIMTRAHGSPKIALLHLTSGMEAATARLLDSNDLLPTASLLTNVRHLVRENLLPAIAEETVSQFVEIRNQVAHGTFSADSDVLLATIDVGVSILNTITLIASNPHAEASFRSE